MSSLGRYAAPKISWKSLDALARFGDPKPSLRTDFGPAPAPGGHTGCASESKVAKNGEKSGKCDLRSSKSPIKPGCITSESKMFRTCWRKERVPERSLQDFPDLQAEDIRAAIAFAANLKLG